MVVGVASGMAWQGVDYNYCKGLGDGGGYEM